MLKLSGYLSATEIDKVYALTNLRFDKKFNIKAQEALILYEQRMLDEDIIITLCEEDYNTGLKEEEKIKLETPRQDYIPLNIIDLFAGLECVPVSYNVAANTLIVGVLPETYNNVIIVGNYIIHKVRVPIFYYVDLYAKYYGNPKFLLPIPITEKFDTIVQEALMIGASDITISSLSKGASVYYNRNKRKIHSRRRIEKPDVEEIAKLLATTAGATMDDITATNIPRYFSVPIDIHHRGRVVVNGTYYGHSITIRVLSNDALNVTLEDLNIKNKTCDFIRDVALSNEKGLRIFIGETSSGKNTTILAGLRELVLTDKYKIVSVEQPVEILVDGMEQIPASTDKEYEKNADSLLRCNPDILYFTEITARTAESVMKASNTGKVVFTSLHANSIADCISRLKDITGLTTDRLISTIQCCVYQQLERDEEKDMVFPYNRCIHFTDSLKQRLYNKELFEINTTLKDIESEWDRENQLFNRKIVPFRTYIIERGNKYRRKNLWDT